MGRSYRFANRMKVKDLEPMSFQYEQEMRLW